MIQQLNQIIIYKFIIEADSPVHFGGSEQGKLIINSKGKPILLGNSIAGALRAYLEQLNIGDEIIHKFMGGSIEDQFIESRIYISDGQVRYDREIKEKEGTAIDSSYGSARDNHKYTLEYLDAPFTISFEIECEIDHKSPNDLKIFEKIIGTWARGFETKQIRLGGQQNNGFGIFKLLSLEKKVYQLNSLDNVDRYIFSRDLIDFENVNIKSLDSYEMNEKDRIVFSMKGIFPYGVYQAFKIDSTHSTQDSKTITGLQQRGKEHYIPASSIKGLVKNEIRILLNRFMGREKAERELDYLFGNQEIKGRVIFQDMKFEGEPVMVKGSKKQKDQQNGDRDTAVYIKIDRITGGVIPGALKNQKEVCGESTLQCELILEDGKEEDVKESNNFMIFLILYALRRIGSGFAPIGGRTVIGLGEFKAERVDLSGTRNLSVSVGTELTQNEIEQLKSYFDSFERRCVRLGNISSSIS